jgi:hypothetical protein
MVGHIGDHRTSIVHRLNWHVIVERVERRCRCATGPDIVGHVTHDSVGTRGGDRRGQRLRNHRDEVVDVGAGHVR